MMARSYITFDPVAYKAEYYAKNREKILLQHKEYLIKNKEDINRRRRERKKARRDEENALQKQWRINNPVKALLHAAKSRAKKKGWDFEIAEEDVGEFPDVCPLLGIPIIAGSKDIKNQPSIDRKDPSKGYVPGNVWIISRRANIIKNDASSKELMMIASNLEKLGNI